MASVSHRVTEDGTQEIGIRDGKLFVPFASLSGARYEQLRERAENQGAADDDDDDETNGKAKG